MNASRHGTGKGLSPRVRGNRTSLCDLRSIPACAGEPQCRILARSIPACAGEPRTPPGVPRWSGLSPRVRGNLIQSAYIERCKRRSIPACAGEPWLSFPTVAARVRGNLTTLHVDGSIPACAGEPMRWRSIATHVDQAIFAGLSPRVRGNRSVAAIGSIPACAGEPQQLPIPRRGNRVKSDHHGVYPRVCGGTLPRLASSRGATLVYPRVCGGTVSVKPRFFQDGRSIPACAGEPGGTVGSVSKQNTVYPRVCGGTSHYCPMALSGLSPRVRGNHCQSPHVSYPRVCGGTRYQVWDIQLWVYPRVCGGTRPEASCRRSIPACAGEPC